MNHPPQGDERRRYDAVGRLVRRGLPLFLLILVMAGAYIYWRRVDAAPKHEAPPPPRTAVPVTVRTVRPETVPMHMRFLGQTEASKIVEIRARVAGYLGERSFNRGDRVEKGQKLFQIDPRPFEVALAEARAGLAVAEAMEARARERLERIERLLELDAAALEELRDYRTEVRVAAAEVRQQKALIAAAELQLGYTSIEAPMTGEIGPALRDPGSYVDAGPSGLLAVLQQVDPIDVRYSVTEQEMLQFRRRQMRREILVPSLDRIELEITLADNTTYPHKGWVDYIDIAVDKTTGTAVIRGQAPNPDGLLKPGQLIYANVLGIQEVNVLQVPQRAVLQSPSGANVFVVNSENVAEIRPVQLGEWSGTEFWVVRKGLQPGDRVITDQLMTMRAGISVTIAGEYVPVTRPAEEPAPSSQPAATQGGTPR